MARDTSGHDSRTALRRTRSLRIIVKSAKIRGHVILHQRGIHAEPVRAKEFSVDIARAASDGTVMAGGAGIHVVTGGVFRKCANMSAQQELSGEGREEN